MMGNALVCGIIKDTAYTLYLSEQKFIGRNQSIQKFKKGMTVYVNSTWSVAEKCTILDYIENESGTNKKFYKVHSSVHGGTFGATEDCIFATKEEACKAYLNASTQLINKYKSEIRNLEDLLRFPLKHCFCGEYTDYEALSAYKARATELTEIVL